MAEELASRVVSWKEEGVAPMAEPSEVEMVVVALMASLPTSLVLDSRAGTRVYHHMNAFALENAFYGFVVYGHAASGGCDILPPRGKPLPLRRAPCLSYSVGVCV
jgi:hypothetical protein